MRPLLLLSLAAALSSAAGPNDGPTARKPARRPTLGVLARCTGSAGCRACKNCNYCAHCAGGGGTCGVCSSNAAPVRTYRAPARSKPAATRSYFIPPTDARIQELRLLDAPSYVTATTLNLRARPSADAELLRVLSQGDEVQVLEIVNDRWVKVSATSAELGDVQGYVARAYLATEPAN